MRTLSLGITLLALLLACSGPQQPTPPGGSPLGSQEVIDLPPSEPSAPTASPTPAEPAEPAEDSRQSSSGTPTGELPPESGSADAHFPTDDYAAILETYVTADGGFRYAALHASNENSRDLAAVCDRIANATPQTWSASAQLAFYVNAYNALVIQSVIERWPLQSVMRVPGFFDRIRHTVAGRELTLNQLENNIIRGPQFAEPRIHFIVNCASAGCPPLAGSPYAASSLEEQMETQTQSFLRRTTRLQAGTIKVTKLFEWFLGDFGGRDGVRRFLARYLNDDLAARVRDPGTRIGTYPYDWSINSRP